MIQNSINSLIPNGGLINLSLNAAGTAQNKKNVAIYNGTQEVLTGDLLNNAATEQLSGNVSRFITNLTGEGTAILAADIQEPVQVMQHPLETGAKVTDHTVQMPKTCKFTIVMPFYFAEPVIKELLEFKQNSTLLTVKALGQVLTNMVINNVSRPINIKAFARPMFEVSLQEALQVETTIEAAGNVRFADDSNTQTCGLKYPWQI